MVVRLCVFDLVVQFCTFMPLSKTIFGCFFFLVRNDDTFSPVCMCVCVCESEFNAAGLSH